MTIVAAARFHDATLIVADSRGTWIGTGRDVYEDRLQKILPVGAKSVLAFAGPVDVAAEVAHHLNHQIRRRPHDDSPRMLVHHLPRIAKHHYQKWSSRYARPSPLAFVLSGQVGHEVPKLWRFDSPDFRAVSVPEWCVVGSGQKAAVFLRDQYASLSLIKELAERSDSLRNGLAEALRPHGEMTVGGMFQTLVLTPEGTRPINYRYMDLDPYRAPRGMSMSMERGRWIQRNLVGGHEVPLEQPRAFVSRRASPVMTENYVYRPLPELRWHLSHFVTCLEIVIDNGTIEFRGVLSQIGAVDYPASLSMWGAVAFWGPAGRRDLVYRLVSTDRVQTLLSKEIELKIFPEEFETVDELKLEVERPGLYFIECWLNDFRLARRSMWFGQLDEPPIDEQSAQRASDRLVAEHRTQSDQVVEGEKCPAVAYHTVCRGVNSQGMTLRFDRQFVAVYWQKYPANIPATVATGLRLPPGKISLKLILVNAQTGKETVISEFHGSASSSALVTPIEGDMLLPVEQAGFHYVNVVVGCTLVATTLVAFETMEPQFMYSLHDEAIKDISEGTLIYLQKRSRQYMPPEVETKSHIP